MVQIQYNQIVQKIITPITICDPLLISNIEYQALWDTGAIGTVVSLKVVADLKLTPCGNVTVKLGNKTEIPAKAYEIKLLNTQTQKPTPFIVAGFDIPDVDVIIGMDVITKGEFIFKLVNGGSEFSFTI